MRDSQPFHSMGKIGLLSMVLLLAMTLPAPAQDLWEVSPSNPSDIHSTNSGRVGIGTDAPSTDLHVHDETSAAKLTLSSGGGNVAFFLDAGPGEDPGFVFKESGVRQFRLFVDNPGGVLTFRAGTNLDFMAMTLAGDVGIGTETPTARLDVVGSTKTEVLEITGGSDLAEPFEIRSPATVLPGTVVSIDPDHPGELRITDRAYDRTVAGIVSGANGVATGLLMSQEGSIASGSYPVALTGRVYVLADASSGPIKPGDLLTSSDIAGHAMKATDMTKATGAIVGKALSALEEGQGLVFAVVSLQ